MLEIAANRPTETTSGIFHHLVSHNGCGTAFCIKFVRYDKDIKSHSLAGSSLMSGLESVLLSFLPVSEEKEELVAAMSSEIEALWPCVYSDPEKKFSLLEATHTLKGFRESVVVLLTSGVKEGDRLSLAIGVAINAFLNAYNCIGVSLGRLNHEDDFYLSHASRVIEQQMIKAEDLNGVVSRAMYLLYVLPDILGRDSFGVMAARICAATALMGGGYAPLPLISDLFMFRSDSVKTEDEIAQNLSNYFIECYHHTARSILGDELFVITKIDRVLSKRALEVFGDEVKARRWLSRPLARYQNIPPSAYARMGHAKEVLEYLIRIEQGYFG